MHHYTIHATMVAPVDKQSPDPTWAKVGSAPECPQIRSRGAGAAPRRPQARPDNTAPAHKVAEGLFGLRWESGGERRATGPA